MDKQNAVDLPSRNVRPEDENKDKFMVKLLHRKNSVIHMVRSQMINFEQKYSQERKRRSIYTRIWHRRYYILLLIMIALLAWFSAMYGAVLGAIICENKHFFIIHKHTFCWSAHTSKYAQFRKPF